MAQAGAEDTAAETSSGGASDRRSGAATALVVGAAWALQLWVVSRFLPPARVLAGALLPQDDYVLHFARARTVARELFETGRLWVYDPGLMAGYPLGATVFDLDNQGTTALVALLSGLGLGEAVAFDAVVWTCLALGPLALFAASRLLDLPRAAAAAAAAAAVIPTIMTRNLEYGMFAGFFAAYFSVLVVALAHRHLERPSAGRFAALAGAGGLGVFMHVFVGMLVLVPCTLLVLAHARRRPGRTLLHAGAVALAVTLPNLPWLVPFLRLAPVLGWDYEHTFFQTGGLAWALERLLLPFAGFFVLLLALAAAGLAAGWRRSPRPLAIAWTGWVLALLVAVLQGSRIPFVDRLAPANLTLPLAFALCPWAGLGAAELVRRLSGARAAAPGARARPAWAALPFAPHLLLLVAGVAALPPLPTGVPPGMQELERRLRAHTDASARILIEDRLHVERPPLDRDVPLHPYGGGHYLALLPGRIDRELLGGPYAEAPIRPHAADFHSARAFGRPLPRWRPEALRERLVLYNVGWVVAWSAAAKAYLREHPGLFQPVDAWDVFALFRTRLPHSWLVRGSGAVAAAPNRIDVRGAGPDGVVLKYHWLPGFCSDPPLPVHPVPGPGRALPFLGVENAATRDFTLRPAGCR